MIIAGSNAGLGADMKLLRMPFLDCKRTYPVLRLIGQSYALVLARVNQGLAADLPSEC